MSGRAVTDALRVSLANLRVLDPACAQFLEAGRAHLRELAYTLTADHPRMEVLLERMEREVRLGHVFDALEENKPFLDTAFSRLSTFEQIELCRLVCEAMPELPIEALLVHDEPIPRSAQGVIAYLRNSFTDRAYRVFSSTLSRARSEYHDSYGAACEAVSAGNCEACILPIEHTQDGKLLGFYRLIDRYELKIVCTCDLDQQDGSESRFALLKKNFTRPRPSETGERFFELSVTRSTDDALAPLLDAARLSGLSLRRIDSIPLAYSDDRFACHAVYGNADEAQLKPFLIYLTLAVPQYNPIGLYTHITE